MASVPIPNFPSLPQSLKNAKNAGRKMPTEIGEVTKDYLRKYPTFPSLTIAKMILKQYPEFENTEKLRTNIRYYRGSLGSEKLGDLASDEFINQPYGLPTPDVYDSTPFIVKEKCGIMLPDTHFPFQDNQAIKATLDWTKKQQENHPIDFILLTGDMIDCYQLSHFEKDPKQRPIEEEVNAIEDFFQTLVDEFPGVKIYYKESNHEHRFERYVFQNAPGLAGLEQFSLEAVMHLKQYGIEYIKNKRVIQFGHLNIIHGDEYQRGMGNPVNPARSIFLKAKEPTLVAHSHITSEHSGRTIGRKLITCWSMGCLCQLNPKWNPLNDWNHGFAFVTRDDSGIFRVVNLRIENGVVY